MELDDLRRAVARKRAAQEARELKDELHGTNEPVDPDVLYLTLKEAASELGLTAHSLRSAIREGRLKARMAKARGWMWVVHPKDFEAFQRKYYPRLKE